MKLEISGEGKPVLLIHGFLESADMWTSWLQSAPKGFKYCTVTLPGHPGSSEPWKKGVEIKHIADRLGELLKKEGVAPEKIIGHSLGGYVGLELMSVFKNSQLALLNSNFWEDSSLKKNERLRVAKVVEKNYPLFLGEAVPNLFMPSKRKGLQSTIRQLKEDAREMRPPDVVQILLAMKNRRDFSPLSRDLLKRVLVIHGLSDPLIKKTVFDEKIKQSLSQENYFVIQDSGHMSLWENPTKTFETLNRFLTQV